MTSPGSLPTARPLLLVHLALAAAFLVSPFGAAAQERAGGDAGASELHVDVRERVLDNGVTVLVWERPGVGRIGARVFYRVDVAAERPGTVGLTHMLEHYLFMGSHRVGTTDWEAERPFAEAVEVLEREITDERNRNRACFLQRDVFAEVEVACTTPRLDSLETALARAFEAQQRFASGTAFDWIYQPAGGTGLTASTGRDWMKFDIDLPTDALELFMWMERSRVENPVFRFFEPEREVVVDQIRRADNRPDGPFLRALRSMTYDAHPYGWAHWFSDLTRATREDHWEIFHRYFIPQNTVIVVVGDVEADEVFRQAERYWGSWLPGRPSSRLRTVEPPPVGARRLVAEAAAGPSVVIHAPMPAVGHSDAAAMEVLARVLGDDRGLLERALVDERGVATSVEASAWLAKYPSHVTIRADARANGDLEAVEGAIDSVLAAVAAGEVDEAVVAAAVDRMVLDLARGLERVGASAVRIGSMEAIHGWRHLNELPVLWAAVGVDDLARVVGTYLAPTTRTVGVLRRTEGRGEARAEGPAEGPAGELLPAALPGGPIEEWARGGEAAGRPSSGRRRVVAASSRVPAPAEASAGPDASGTPPGPVVPGDGHRARVPAPPEAPLAVAEAPWFAPPWMSDRRVARFSEPPPVAHWEALMPPPAAPRLPRAEDHRVRLGAGYRGFVVVDSLLPMVQISALVGAGELDDPEGGEGLARLTGRAVALGGTDALGPEALEDRLRVIGASLTVRTDRLHTRLHLLAPAGSAEEAARLIGRIVAAPRLDPGVLDRERTRAAVAAGRSLDAAGAVVDDLFHRALFPEGHPLARRATRASVEGLGRDDLLRFHRERWCPGRVVFAVSGRLDPAALVGALDGALAAASAAGAGEPACEPGEASAGGTRFVAWTGEPARSAESAELRVVTRDLPTSRQGHVILGHPGLDGIPEDHAALEIMHHVLAGGAFVSRMMERLRTDTGITSALYGSVEPGPGLTFPYLWRFSGNPGTLAEGVRLAVREIERMREEGVTEREFEAARTSFLQGLIPASYETPQRAAERFAERALLGRYLYQSPGYLNYYAGDAGQAEAIRALTLDDVNRAARRYLRPDALVIAVVGPLEAIRAGASDEDRRFVTPAGG